jgi:hypothetical protein
MICEEGAAISTLPKVIDVKHFEQADALLTYLCQWIPVVYSFLGLSKEGEVSQKVIKYIASNHGFVTNAKLYRAMSKHMNTQTLRGVLDSMIKGKIMEVEELPEPHIDGDIGYKLVRKLEEI